MNLFQFFKHHNCKITVPCATTQPRTCSEADYLRRTHAESCDQTLAQTRSKACLVYQSMPEPWLRWAPFLMNIRSMVSFSSFTRSEMSACSGSDVGGHRGIAPFSHVGSVAPRTKTPCPYLSSAKAVHYFASAFGDCNPTKMQLPSRVKQQT